MRSFRPSRISLEVILTLVGVSLAVVASCGLPALAQTPTAQPSLTESSSTGASPAESLSTFTASPLATTRSPESEDKTDTVATKVRDARRRAEIEFRTKIDQNERERTAIYSSKQAQLRARLDRLQDKTKTAQAERLAQVLNALNVKMSQHELRYLKHLELIGDRLESRLSKAEADGINLAAAKSKLASARAALDTAKQTVLAQQTKIYSADFNTAAELKPAFVATHHQLRQDHLAIKASLKDVKKQLEDTFESLRTAIATASATPSPAP